MKTITFKSIPEMYRKEYLGLKRNTIRKCDNSIRFEILEQYIYNQLVNLSIKIINTETNESFTRQVTDVTFWEGFYIISW